MSTMFMYSVTCTLGISFQSAESPHIAIYVKNKITISKSDQSLKSSDVVAVAYTIGIIWRRKSVFRRKIAVVGGNGGGSRDCRWIIDLLLLVQLLNVVRDDYAAVKFNQPYKDEDPDDDTPHDLEPFLTSFLLEVVGRTIDAVLNIIVSSSVEERIEEENASGDVKAKVTVEHGRVEGNKGAGFVEYAYETE